MTRLILMAAALTLSACATAGGGGAPGPAPDPVAAEAVKWTCKDGAVFFTQATRGGNVEVAAYGATTWLPKVKAASGARYRNKTTEFWEKGGEAMLSGAGGPAQSGCKKTP